MRLAENKIKQAILYPESEVRRTAVKYFSESYSPDPTVMPLVIKAVEQYGWEHAYMFIGSARTLAQTDDTIQWVLAELNRKIDEKDDDQVNYLYNLGMMLYHADPGLLLRYESDLIESRGLDSRIIEGIMERLRMLSWDGETCWKALEEFCEKEKDARFVNEVNLGYANHLVEALARDGQKYVDRVLALLSEDWEDVSDSPMKWWEPLTVQLAGEMRLESAIPFITKKLKIDTDFLSEQCGEALIKIGTDSAVQAIYEPFAEADWHYRLYACEPLEHIHTDLAVARCLELLAKEKDPGIKTSLGFALLSHFAYDGIEAVRQLILSGKWDPLITDLRGDLVTACTIMGEHFPEYDQWKVDVEGRRAERQQRLRETMGSDIVDALKKTFCEIEKEKTKRTPASLQDGSQLTNPVVKER